MTCNYSIYHPKVINIQFITNFLVKPFENQESVKDKTTTHNLENI